MYLHLLLSAIFLSISQVTPTSILNVRTVDEDAQLLGDNSLFLGDDSQLIGDDSQVVGDTPSIQTFPTSDDALTTNSEKFPPISGLVALEDLTPSERLLNLAPTEPNTVPDILQNGIYWQNNNFQLAHKVPLSQPLYPSCDDLRSQNCKICRSMKGIPLVCAVADKAARNVAGDTLCIHASTEPCVPFDKISNYYSNHVATLWDVADVRKIWDVPTTHLPENPGEMSGFCRMIDVLTECRICTRQERSDCTPSRLEIKSGASLVCNDKDGCTRFEN